MGAHGTTLSWVLHFKVRKLQQNTDEDADDNEDEDDDDDEQEEENLEEQNPGLSRKIVRVSLSDLPSLEEVEGMSELQLKESLAQNFVNSSGCCEQWELVENVNRLYKENEENQKSYGEGMQLQDEEDDSQPVPNLHGCSHWSCPAGVCTWSPAPSVASA